MGMTITHLTPPPAGRSRSSVAERIADTRKLVAEAARFVGELDVTLEEDDPHAAQRQAAALRATVRDQW